MTKNMKIAVTFETTCTGQWLGKVDADGNNVYEDTWNAKAYVFGHMVAETSLRYIYKTEAAAIRAAEANLKENM